MYTLGIGSSVDLSLIIRAAEAGKGLHEFSKKSEFIEEKLNYLINDALTEFLDEFSI